MEAFLIKKYVNPQLVRNIACTKAEGQKKWHSLTIAACFYNI